jgi:hypothetical protein
MMQQFCDRCRADVSDKRSAAVRVVDDADPDGNGRVTDGWDLCPRCLKQLRTWISGNRDTRKKK